MKKSAHRNVYALRGTPFVLVNGRRLYARNENTTIKAGQKLECSRPRIDEISMTVKVRDPEGRISVFGGKLDSGFVEVPIPKKNVPPRYKLVHPTCGTLFI